MERIVKLACVSVFALVIVTGCGNDPDGGVDARPNSPRSDRGESDSGMRESRDGGGNDGGGNSNCPAPVTPAGAVDLLPLSDATPTVQQDDAYVYVADGRGSATKLRRVAKSDGSVSIVRELKYTTHLVSVDSAHVYYVEHRDIGRSHLLRVSKAGGEPEEMRLPDGRVSVPGTKAMARLDAADAGTHLVWLAPASEAASGPDALFALDKANKTILHVLDESDDTGVLSRPTVADGVVYMGSNLRNLSSFPMLWSWPLSGAMLMDAGRVGLGARVHVRGPRVLSDAAGVVMESALGASENPRTMFSPPRNLLPFSEYDAWIGESLYKATKFCGVLLEISTREWSSDIVMAGALRGAFVADVAHIYYVGANAANEPVLRKAPR